MITYSRTSRNTGCFCTVELHLYLSPESLSLLQELTFFDQVVLKQWHQAAGVSKSIGQADASHSGQLPAFGLLEALQEEYQLPMGSGNEIFMATAVWR